MKSSKRKIIGSVFIGGAVLVAVALSFIPRTVVSGRVSGRDVMGRMASLFAPARYLSDGKSATVQLGSQTLKVNASQVELSGGRIIRIPANCKQVELLATRSDVRVLFDGQRQQ
jgi:hypothetical protein